MSDLVPSEDIERIVGRERHDWAHYGRAVSSEQVVYVLHSRQCKDSGIDLRDCPYSVAMDTGIHESVSGNADQVVLLMVSPISGKLLGRVTK